MGFFFLLGATATSLVLILGTYLVFSISFRDRIYPGVLIAGTDFGGQKQEDVKFSFNPELLSGVTLELTSTTATVTATGSELGLSPDRELMSRRAFSIGRQTKNPYYNLLQILAAFQGKINLPMEISVDRKSLDRKLEAISGQVETPPVDAEFKFDANAGADLKGRVVAFKQSTNGVAIDREKLSQEIISQAKQYLNNGGTTEWLINIPLKDVLPQVTSSTADEMGIKDLLGEGGSFFYDSIPGRVHNINLGQSKIDGRLVAPGEIFSFDQSIGTVSAIFGYAKAYSIIKGKTVLDDGGGVCQVSTTLYRAVLNAGLPVVERVAHTYRVGFYEEGGYLPGLDATVYPPSPDFRFKNDTGHWILIQSTFDPDNAKLTFDIFGTSDGRKTEIKGPYILSTSPPPPTVYEDDPTLPVGQVNQIDTAHYGASVYFQRIVTRGNETLINETVRSDYVPWAARFMKGTKT